MCKGKEKGLFMHIVICTLLKVWWRILKYIFYTYFVQNIGNDSNTVVFCKDEDFFYLSQKFVFIIICCKKEIFSSQFYVRFWFICIAICIDLFFILVGIKKKPNQTDQAWSVSCVFLLLQQKSIALQILTLRNTLPSRKYVLW